MGRQRCSGCERPLSVCLCSQLPWPPLRTGTCVVVLQHPHEARHKLSTLPVLTKCLANCHVLQGRRFQAGCSPLLDSFSSQNAPNRHALLLFPTSSAQPISAWFAHYQRQRSCPLMLMKNTKHASRDQLDASCHTIKAANTSDCKERQHVKAHDTKAGTLGLLASHPHFPIEQEEVSTYDSVSPSQQAGECSNFMLDPDSHFQHVSTFTGVSYSGLRQPGVDNHVSLHCQHASSSSSVSCDSTVCSQQICSQRDTNSPPESLCTSTPASADSSFPHLVLIAVDATWQHANEMIKVSSPYLNKFVVPVCLPFDTDQEGFGMANSELIMRKEPFKGCMTTLEAIASCLKVLEPNGVEIHEKLLCVLRSMVLFQASNIASHRVRCTRKNKCDCLPRTIEVTTSSVHL